MNHKSSWGLCGGVATISRPPSKSANTIELYNERMASVFVRCPNFLSTPIADCAHSWRDRGAHLPARNVDGYALITASPLQCGLLFLALISADGEVGRCGFEKSRKLQGRRFWPLEQLLGCREGVAKREKIDKEQRENGAQQMCVREKEIRRTFHGYISAFFVYDQRSCPRRQ